MSEIHKPQFEKYIKDNDIKEKHKKAISFFFNHCYKELNSGKLPEIRMKYFGVFSTNIRQLNNMKTKLLTYFQQGLVTEEEYNKYISNIDLKIQELSNE